MIDTNNDCDNTFKEQSSTPLFDSDTCHPQICVSLSVKPASVNSVVTCKVFTRLSMFSLITIEFEPDIFYIKGVLNDSCDGL